MWRDGREEAGEPRLKTGVPLKVQAEPASNTAHCPMFKPGPDEQNTAQCPMFNPDPSEKNTANCAKFGRGPNERDIALVAMFRPTVSARFRNRN